MLLWYIVIIDIPTCTKRRGICGKHATCRLDSVTDYRCECHPGFRKKTANDPHSQCEGAFYYRTF